MSSPLTAEEVDKVARQYLWKRHWLERNTGEQYIIQMDMIAYSSRGKNLIYRFTDPELSTFSQEFFMCLFSEYGETWRLWDNEPTEEERKTAEWKTA